MSYLLSTPNSRKRIITTQAIFMAASVTFLIALIGLAGLCLTQAMFPGELDVAKFMSLNLGVIALFLALSSVSLLFSCWFNDTKHSLALGGGIPVLFFVMNMLAGTGAGHDWIRYLTLFSLYDPVKILSEEQPVLLTSLALVGIAGALYGLAICVFDRRDLPL